MDKKMIYYEGITHWTRRNDEQTWFINTTFIFALQSTLNYPLADYPGCGLSMLAKKELKYRHAIQYAFFYAYMGSIIRSMTQTCWQLNVNVWFNSRKP